MKKNKLLILIILVIISVLVLSACSPNGYSYSTFKYFNTQSIFVGFEDQNKVNEVWNKVNSELEKYENLFSTDKGTSDIYKFNQLKPNETLQISYDTYKLLEMSKNIYVDTNGAYNPALYSLLDIWGFTPRFTTEEKDESLAMPYDRADYLNELPNDEYISELLKLTDFTKVEFYEEDSKYFIKKPSDTITIAGKVIDYKLDLGGIAKGYILDKVNNLVKENAINKGYISIGMSSLMLLEGNRSNGNWEVELNHPRNVGKYCKVYTKNTSFTTSGDYEKYYEINNKRYSHIIDSKSGKPFENSVMSVSISNYDSTNSDALATALCVMGKDAAIDYFNKNMKGAKILMLCNENSKNVLYTNIDKNEIKLVDSSIEIKNI